ncbi:MbtH domain protein [Brasilonema sp. CT11]|nr:MbtH domain protein [Brasilonema sp. CT11]
MDDLVKRLSEGAYPVSASEFHKSAEELRQSIHRGYVYVKFTDTKGGTQLGVRLDRGATDLSHADFQQASGKIDLVGDLNLNGIDIRCIANFDLATLQGTGRVEIVEH